LAIRKREVISSFSKSEVSILSKWRLNIRQKGKITKESDSESDRIFIMDVQLKMSDGSKIIIKIPWCKTSGSR
jgi:hypothetical protein